MPVSRPFRSILAISAISVLAVAAGGCTNTTPKLGLGGSNGYYAKNGKTSGPEYFSAASLGVFASPKVASGKRMPRGGGRDQVGKPYTVAGTTYYPTENPKPVQKGRASWYGAAFHGRLTANGEVYDMNHLTAAHKTMPLPSYARVTNLDNGRSVMVRVNDRGPFAHDRVIDLSKRAADILDYTTSGTANVKVEYAGRAPLEGNDDRFLLASVRGVPGAPERGGIGSFASGIAVALTGSTPRGNARRPSGSLPGVRTAAAANGSSATATRASTGSGIVASGALPVPATRPAIDTGGIAVSAYADERVKRAFPVIDVAGTALAWKRR